MLDKHVFCFVIAMFMCQKTNFYFCKINSIVPPPHSWSYNFNYKGFHSIVLMVLAQYEFLYVDVGKNGRMSDGGVFAQMEFAHCLQAGGLALPRNKDNVEALPFVFFVADVAFGLGPHLMMPFPQRRVLNYRLDRARRVVENAFGIMTRLFCLLQTAIHMADYKPNTFFLLHFS